MYEPYKRYLETLHDTDKYRTLPGVLFGKKADYLDFSSNDYLALSQDQTIIEAFISAARQFGAGSTGSRLLSGNTVLHEQLEAQIAKSKGTQAALIFNSGFQANISTLAALLDSRVLGNTPLVFFDKLNHASLYQAVFLSKATLVRYRHNDMAQLLTLLSDYQEDNRPKWIIAETVFGMDGDVLPIAQIAHLAKQYKTFLYLDEAHATGLLGCQGYGLSTDVDLSEIPHIVMGTFSKALGSSGGYVACSALMRDYLVNKASGFIYSTALCPGAVGAALKAWQKIATMQGVRHQLQELGCLLRGRLQSEGFDIGQSSTHIVPIILKKEETVLKVKMALLKKKILVSAIRPPTVALHSSRLRLALNTGHTVQDIENLVTALKRVI